MNSTIQRRITADADRGRIGVELPPVVWAGSDASSAGIDRAGWATAPTGTDNV